MFKYEFIVTISLDSQESAMNAILSQGQLKDENHRLTIEWSRGKGSGRMVCVDIDIKDN